MNIFSHIAEGLASIGKAMATFTIFPKPDFDADIKRFKDTVYNKHYYRQPAAYPTTWHIKMDWHCMSSAPMDGTEILLCVHVDEQEQAYVGAYSSMRNKWVIYCYPTGEKPVAEKKLLGWHPIPYTEK